MIFAGEDGRQVLLSAIEGDDATLERLRDLIALRLSDRGVAHWKIGRVLGLSRARVTQRLAALPPEARSFYRGSLD